MDKLRHSVYHRGGGGLCGGRKRQETPTRETRDGTVETSPVRRLEDDAGGGDELVGDSGISVGAV